jgi:hypothetical protein
MITAPANIYCQAVVILFGLLVTSSNTDTYEQVALEETVLALKPSEKNVIDGLSVCENTIPSWVVAQLLDASDRLGKAFPESSDTNTDKYQYKLMAPLMTLNTLLADSASHRGQLISIRGLFYSAQRVNAELLLAGQDHCWSVIILDSRYQRPIQVFTTKPPAGFTRGAIVCAVGYYLSNRMDQIGTEHASQPVAIPVLMGVIRSNLDGAATGSRFQNRFFFGVILFLTATYLLIRIYIARSGGKLSRRFSVFSRHAGQCKQ